MRELYSNKLVFEYEFKNNEIKSWSDFVECRNLCCVDLYRQIHDEASRQLATKLKDNVINVVRDLIHNHIPNKLVNLLECDDLFQVEQGNKFKEELYFLNSTSGLFKSKLESLWDLSPSNCNYPENTLTRFSKSNTLYMQYDGYILIRCLLNQLNSHINKLKEYDQ